MLIIVIQEDVFTDTLFAPLPPPPTSLKEEAVLSKAELSPPLSPLPYADSLKSDNKSVAAETLYHSRALGAPT